MKDNIVGIEKMKCLMNLYSEFPINVRFYKESGVIRDMKCTLDERIEESNVALVLDHETHLAYRRFKLNNVIHFVVDDRKFYSKRYYWLEKLRRQIQGE